MKRREFEELKAKTTSELATNLKDKKNELFNLRFQLATGQLENTAAIMSCKRDIARVQTIIRQRAEA
ncbi:50S ribosomal protein L29 [Eubacteriales bacterium OttesenSCG-928-N13]|nr:50S ribosomal protein L29 [Eubacteriales bacterium OttesenSCG-928-N13]